MRFFHDQEFLEDGRTIKGISIGIVAEDGQEYYAVFRDILENSRALTDLRRHSWLMANVVPHLPEAAQRVIRGGEPVGLVFAGHPVIKPAYLIANEVREFIEQYGPDRDEHELWTYYGAYDHVMLAQMYGPMVQLPPCIPMHTNDIKALVSGLERNTNTKIRLPDQPANAHDALADARWNLAAYRAVRDQAAAMWPKQPGPWATTEDTVTVPRHVFVALAERLLSEGPNEGLDGEDQEQVRAVWECLL